MEEGRNRGTVRRPKDRPEGRAKNGGAGRGMAVPWTMRYLIALLALVAACATEPQPHGIAGTYSLVAVAGKPLPAPTRYYIGPSAYDGTITAGLLVMGADSTFAETQSVTDANGQSISQPTALGRWYHADPTAPEYQIEYAGGSLGFIATLHGDTLTLLGRDYVRR